MQDPDCVLNRTVCLCNLACVSGYMCTGHIMCSVVFDVHAQVERGFGECKLSPLSDRTVHSQGRYISGKVYAVYRIFSK